MTKHRRLVDSVERAFLSPPVTVFDKFAFSLLIYISSAIKQLSDPHESYMSLFRTIVTAYVDQYVQREPPPAN